MDRFSFRCTNPGCCGGPGQLFPPDLTAQMNPLITYTHARSRHVRGQNGSDPAVQDEGAFAEAWLAGRAPNSNAPVYLDDASDSGQIHHLCLINIRHTQLLS